MKKVAATRQRWDHYLLMKYPELWRIGYAPILSRYLFLIILLPIGVAGIMLVAYLLFGRWLTDHIGGLFPLAVLGAFLACLANLVFIYRFFYEDRDIQQRHHYGIDEFPFSFHATSERIALVTNFGLLCFSQLYPWLICTILMIFSSASMGDIDVSIGTAKNTEASTSSLGARPPIEEELYSAIQGEYFFLTAYEEQSPATAKNNLKDSLMAILEPSVLGAMSTFDSIFDEAIATYQIGDSSTILNFYINQLYGTPPELAPDASLMTYRLPMSLIGQQFNEKYGVDQISPGGIKAIFLIYFIILAWLLSIFYFKDLYDREMVLVKPQWANWMLQLLKIIVYLGIALGVLNLVGFIILSLLITEGGETNYDQWNDFILFFFNNTLLLYWQGITKIATMLFWLFPIAYLIAYFFMFRGWKYNAYQLALQPTRQSEEPPASDLDKKGWTALIRHLFQPLSTPITKWEQQLDEYFKYHHLSIWKYRLTKVIKWMLVFYLSVGLLYFLSFSLLHFLWSQGQMPLEDLGATIEFVNVLVYVIGPIAIFVLLAGDEKMEEEYNGIVMEFDGLVSKARERIFILASIGLVLFYAVCSGWLFPRIIYLTAQPFVSQAHTYETYYDWVVNPQSDNDEELTALLRAEWYFMDQRERFTFPQRQQLLRDSILAHLSPLYYKPSEALLQSIPQYSSEDSLLLVKDYFYLLRDRDQEWNEQLPLQTYRFGFSEIVTRMNRIGMEDQKYEEGANATFLGAYYMILAFFFMMIYLDELRKKNMKIYPPEQLSIYFRRALQVGAAILIFLFIFYGLSTIGEYVDDTRPDLLEFFNELDRLIRIVNLFLLDLIRLFVYFFPLLFFLLALIYLPELKWKTYQENAFPASSRKDQMN